VWVFTNNDKTKPTHYAAYEDFDPAERQHIRKEANGRIVRDTITTENVLMTMDKRRHSKGVHGQSQTIKLRRKEEKRVTKAIADDRAAHREDTKRREQKGQESEDETSGARSGIGGDGKKKEAERGTHETSNIKNGCEIFCWE
jgi:hypothetical protein